jgi:hypothetical protein
MKKLVVLFMLMLTMTGCQSLGSNFVEGMEDRVRLKWAEEWKPAVMEELENAVAEGKEAAIKEALAKVDVYKAEQDAKLESIGVKVSDFDTNKDGSVSGTESLALLQSIKAKNDAAGNPLSLWEIMMAVAAAYVPLTGAKELAKKKMNGTGDGTQPA